MASAAPEVVESDSAPLPKLRVLCLHSFRTNAEIMDFQFELAGFKAALEDIAEFVCCDAPYTCSEQDLRKLREHHPDVLEAFPSDTFGEYREWFNASDDGGHEYRRLGESVAHIQRFIRERGPFHGIFGFSQGSAMATIIVGKQLSGDLMLGLKFAWLHSGRLPRDDVCAAVFGAVNTGADQLEVSPTAAPWTFPVLASRYSMDDAMPPARTQQVADAFSDSVLVTIPATKPTHAVPKLPRDSEPLRLVREFLLARQKDAAVAPAPLPPADPTYACEKCAIL